MVLMVFLLAHLDLKLEWSSNLTDMEVYRSRALAVADNGVVALIDRDAAQVVYLDATGKLKMKLDKKGQGPGELEGPVEITWSKADQAFFIIDFNNSRFSYWNADGQFIREIPFKGIRFFSPKCKDEKTAFFTRHSGGMAGDPALLRYDLKTGKHEPVWQYKPPPRKFSNGGTADHPINVLFRWDPQLWFGLGSNFLAVAYGDQRRIQILDFDGRQLEKPIKPQLPKYPVTDTQIEDGIWHLPSSFHTNLRNGLVKPDGWPFIMKVHVDNMDRIWVIGGSPDLGKPHKLHVYNTSGRLLGTGEINQVPDFISNDGLYYLRKEPDGGSLFLEKAGFKFTNTTPLEN